MNTFVFHEALRCMAHHDPTIQNIWVQTGHQQHALFPELSESELQPYILNAVLHRLKFDAANRSKVRFSTHIQLNFEGRVLCCNPRYSTINLWVPRYKVFTVVCLGCLNECSCC